MQTLRFALLRAVFVLGFAAFLFLAGGCADEAAPTSRSLKNGKQIQVLYSQEESFGEKEKVLMFGYRTTTNIDDLAALKKEAEEIWETLREEADTDGYQRVVIMPHEHTPEMINDRSGQFRFAYVKSAGQWKME